MKKTSTEIKSKIELSGGKAFANLISCDLELNYFIQRSALSKGAHYLAESLSSIAPPSVKCLAIRSNNNNPKSEYKLFRTMQLNDQIKRIFKIMIFAFLCAEMQTSKSNKIMDLLILHRFIKHNFFEVI